VACGHDPGDAWAARRHERAGEEVCPEAWDARNAYQAEWKRTRRGKPGRRAYALRQPGELYGAELQEATLRHLKEHPVGLTAFETARGMRYRNPQSGGGERVLRALWALHVAGRARFEVAPYADGSRRMTRRWFPA
jgi:hypothetical protein